MYTGYFAAHGCDLAYVVLSLHRSNALLSKADDWMETKEKHEETKCLHKGSPQLSQARSILYSAAQDATGYDLRPLRSMESGLINLSTRPTRRTTSSAERKQRSKPQAYRRE